MADNDTAELIMPDGGIEKCEHIQHRDNIGSIYSSQHDEKKITEWKETVHFEECDHCALYPQCLVLKKCDTANFGCNKADRSLKRFQLEKQIMHAYKQYMKSIQGDEQRDTK